MFTLVRISSIANFSCWELSQLQYIYENTTQKTIFTTNFTYQPERGSHCCVFWCNILNFETVYVVEVNKENINNIVHTNSYDLQRGVLFAKYTLSKALKWRAVGKRHPVNKSPYATIYTNLYGIVSLFRNQ